MSSAVVDRPSDVRPEGPGGSGGGAGSAGGGAGSAGGAGGVREQQAAAQAGPASATSARSAQAASGRSRGRAVAVQVVSALLLLVVLLFGYFVYLFGLSNLSEQRAQDTLRKSFSHRLAAAVAPVGVARQGTPVAVLDIPRIRLRDAVVVEGTSARDLTNGPGHSVGSVLPGQGGTSVIFGRRSTFGAPFAHLMRLDRGDRITVTTGQGRATYVVSSFGDMAHPAPANSANTLLLVTADTGVVPGNYVTVSADLVGPAKPSSGGTSAVSPDQLPLHRGLDDSLLPALLWSQALVVVALLGVVAFVRWKPSAAHLCITPLVLVVVWNLYENLACLNPNLL